MFLVAGRFLLVLVLWFECMGRGGLRVACLDFLTTSRGHEALCRNLYTCYGALLPTYGSASELRNELSLDMVGRGEVVKSSNFVAAKKLPAQ